jgi:hypothetical protein
MSIYFTGLGSSGEFWNQKLLDETESIFVTDPLFPEEYGRAVDEGAPFEESGLPELEKQESATDVLIKDFDNNSHDSPIVRRYPPLIISIVGGKGKLLDSAISESSLKEKPVENFETASESVEVPPVEKFRGKTLPNVFTALYKGQVGHSSSESSSDVVDASSSLEPISEDSDDSLYSLSDVGEESDIEEVSDESDYSIKRQRYVKNKLLAHEEGEVGEVEKPLLPTSKTPIMDALVYCAYKKLSINIHRNDQDAIQFQVTNWVSFLKNCELVSNKPRPTTEVSSRLKTFRRWFDGIPWSNNKNYLDPCVITVKRAQESQMRLIITKIKKVCNFPALSTSGKG